jgi:hypothetical protein
MKKKNVVRIPADNSAESIANVAVVVLLGEKLGMGFCETTIISLDGTIEEKLQQYQDATGKEWSGRNERVFTTWEYVEEESLNLGKQPHTITNKITKEAQNKIDALTEEARRTLQELTNTNENKIEEVNTLV